MTPNPESVSPDMTVLDALQMMHDNKFLTLPVCEADGTVLGVVDVMDVIYGCGGMEGWRSVFNSTLDLEDGSDTVSIHSGHRSIGRTGSRGTSQPSRAVKDARSIQMLRPKKPLISAESESVLSVAKMLADNRASAAVIVNNAGGLAGIITDTDFTRRVVAKRLNPAVNKIEDVMTANPKFVSVSDSAIDAMTMMIENNFRHLPVSDSSGAVVGVLDIAKCLNDAISKLEKASDKSKDAAEQLLMQALQNAGQGGAALKALLGPLVSQAFGNQAARPLRTLLSGSPSTIVDSDSSVLEAAVLMAQSRKAALVAEGGKLVGIFGFKDMMSRVIARELDPETTPIAEVMTPNPESVSPDMSVLEALQMMHDHHFLTLPVCEANGTIVGVVNVIDVINGCGGAEGWRAVFDSALEVADDVTAFYSAVESTPKQKTHSSRPAPAVPSVSIPKDTVVRVSKDAPFVTASKVHGNIPTTLEFDEANGYDDGGMSLNDTFLSDLHTVTFKVVDFFGHTHRLKSETKIANLQKAFAEKVAVKNSSAVRFKFVDDEGDAIMVTTDDDLVEAVRLARASSKGGSSAIKLTAIEIEEKVAIDPMILAGVGAAVALVGMVAMWALRPRRYYRF
jgi:CBS domain-containing protein